MKRFFCLLLTLLFSVCVLQAAPGSSPTVAEIRSRDNDCAAFTWNQPDSSEEIKGYYVYWGADEAGASDFFQDNNFSAEFNAPFFDPPPVDDFGEYYLRVRAVDKAGHGGGWATVLTYIYEDAYEDAEEALAGLTEDDYEADEEFFADAADEDEEYFAETAPEDELTAEEEAEYFADATDAEEYAEEEVEVAAVETAAEETFLAGAAQISGGDFVISNASFTFDGEDNPLARPIMLPPMVFTGNGVRYQEDETEEYSQVALRPIILPTTVIADADEAAEYPTEDTEAEMEILEEMFAAAATEQNESAVFNPELPLTRKEMFRMLTRLLEEQGLPLPERTIPQFSDVAGEQLAEAEKAARYGLLRGYPDGTARLNQPIRKAEAACVFARYSAALGEDLAGVFLSAPVFADVPDTHWAYQEIAQTRAFFALAAENYFQPQTELSRLDTARVLAKFKYVQGRRESLPPLTGLLEPSANAAENAQISRLLLPEKEQ
ncbi:MAG: S-layer homology domain-containing protein [Candidatus Margulisbacteria bacterium]|nr:S-layer homology domain-containing protein [Candidatus Margulisiibacteriota bacterium]